MPLVQEDKRFDNPKDPEPQVIAEAIAAFQENNRELEKQKRSSLSAMVIPCITMVGTFPTFYLVPVTEELSWCVRTGSYPTELTTVLRYIPSAVRRVNEGMRPVESRREILKCLDAFKRSVDDLESQLC